MVFNREIVMLVVALSILFLRAVVALKCVPAGCVINVIESGTYTFGIDRNDSAQISECSFESNTGLKGSFSTTPAGKKRIALNNISDFGRISLCQITVKNVNDKGPSLWTLRATNEITQQNFKEINFTVNFSYKVQLLLDTINVIEKGSFYQYINSTVKFSSCKVVFGKTEVDLDVDSVQEVKGNDDRVSSLGGGLCGFVFVNISTTDPSDWSLIASDDEGKSYKNNFIVQIFKRPSSAETNKKIYITLGSPSTINCGNEFNQEFCYLYNPKGEFVVENKDCSHSIKTVALHHLGKWKCYVGKSMSMETLEYVVELVKLENPHVHSWVIEKDKFFSFGCQLTNTPKIESCQMISPNKQVFNLHPGAAYERYLSFGTDLNNGTCALMLRKPLIEDDRGQWRCEIYNSQNSRTGSFIHVNSTKMPKYQTHKTLTTQLGQTLNVQCEVPYSSEYCHIKSPSGTDYSKKDNYESRLGLCSISVDKVTAEHVGNWSCFFARKTGTPDEEIRVKVVIGEILLYTEKIEKSSGGNASLLCSSHGLPLQYCRFVSPNLFSYTIGNHENSSRISYKGKGLEYGECGITITNVLASDSGLWTCITRVGNDYKQDELTATINLYVAPTFLENPVTPIVIGTIGAVFIVSGLTFYGLKKWKIRMISLTPNLKRSQNEDSKEDLVASDYTSYGNLQASSSMHDHQP